MSHIAIYPHYGIPGGIISIASGEEQTTPPPTPTTNTYVGKTKIHIKHTQKVLVRFVSIDHAKICALCIFL